MKQLAVILSTMVFFCSCQKLEFEITNLNNNTITVLGHGGMGLGSLYPMNSMESIMRCLDKGAHGTELDIQMTLDSVLVVFHHQELADKTNKEGLIHSMTWQDLKGAYYTGAPFLQFQVISLNELFGRLEDPSRFWFTLDCKLFPTTPNDSQYQKSFANAIVRLLDQFQLQEQIYIESKSVSFLSHLQSIKPSYKLFIYPSSFEAGLDIASTMGLYGITISTDNITAGQVAQAHDVGLFVALWNTNSHKKNEDAILKNPDCIQTDRLGHLLGLLN